MSIVTVTGEAAVGVDTVSSSGTQIKLGVGSVTFIDLLAGVKHCNGVHCRPLGIGLFPVGGLVPNWANFTRERTFVIVTRQWETQSWFQEHTRQHQYNRSPPRKIRNQDRK